MPREGSSTSRRRAAIIASVIGAIIVIAGVVGDIVWKRTHQTVRVQTTKVQLQTMQRVIFSSGTVKPSTRQLVNATDLSAPVSKLDVAVGNHVSKGQTVIELNNQTQLSAVSQAQNALAEANSAYARALQGYQSAPSILKQIWLPQVDAAQSAVVQAEGQLSTAQAQLGATKIKATMNGTVLVASASGIDASGNQSPILEIVGPSKQVVIELSEVDATHVDKGMKVSMTSDAYPNQTFRGTVSMVAPFAAQTQAGSGQVEVDVSPAGTFTVPYGYQMDCKISSATHKQVPTVPYGALVQQGTSYAVYTYAGGHVHLTSVQLGITNDNAVEVTSGVHAGQIILNNPPANLQDGEAVNVD
jgi:RND family efflux transporter MFP subunit